MWASGPTRPVRRIWHTKFTAEFFNILCSSHSLNWGLAAVGLTALSPVQDSPFCVTKKKFCRIYKHTHKLPVKYALMGGRGTSMTRILNKELFRQYCVVIFHGRQTKHYKYANFEENVTALARRKKKSGGTLSTRKVTLQYFDCESFVYP